MFIKNKQKTQKKAYIGILKTTEERAGYGALLNLSVFFGKPLKRAIVKHVVFL
jgi:hypothetical protein